MDLNLEKEFLVFELLSGCVAVFKYLICDILLIKVILELQVFLFLILWISNLFA